MLNTLKLIDFEEIKPNEPYLLLETSYKPLEDDHTGQKVLTGSGEDILKYVAEELDLEEIGLNSIDICEIELYNGDGYSYFEVYKL